MIGRLLHIANSYPEAVDKKRFYAMKDRILRRYGRRDGFDIQHVAGKKCWSCDGTGVATSVPVPAGSSGRSG